MSAVHLKLYACTPVADFPCCMPELLLLPTVPIVASTRLESDENPQEGKARVEPLSCSTLLTLVSAASSLSCTSVCCIHTFIMAAFPCPC